MREGCCSVVVQHGRSAAGIPAADCVRSTEAAAGRYGWRRGRASATSNSTCGPARAWARNSRPHNTTAERRLLALQRAVPDRCGATADATPPVGPKAAVLQAQHDGGHKLETAGDCGRSHERDLLGVLGSWRGRERVAPRQEPTTAAASTGPGMLVVGGSTKVLNITSGYVTAWNVWWACGPAVRKVWAGRVRGPVRQLHNRALCYVPARSTAGAAGHGPGRIVSPPGSGA